MKLANDGKKRRAESMKTNKWLCDLHDNPATLNAARNRSNKDNEEMTNTMKSSSLRSKKYQIKERSEFEKAMERRNRKILRETIRKKYNLPTRE